MLASSHMYTTEKQGTKTSEFCETIEKSVEKSKLLKNLKKNIIRYRQFKEISSPEIYIIYYKYYIINIYNL